MKTICFMLFVCLLFLNSCRTFLVEDLSLKTDKLEIIIPYIQLSEINDDPLHYKITMKIRMNNLSKEIVEFKFHEIYLSDGKKKVKMNDVVAWGYGFTSNYVVSGYGKVDSTTASIEPGGKIDAPFGNTPLVHFYIDKGFKPNSVILDKYGEIKFDAIYPIVIK